MDNATVREWSTGPDGIATKLRKVRSDAGLTGRALAAKLDWPDYKISKLENGRQMPTVEELTAWAEACETNKATSELLYHVLEEASSLHLTWRGRANTKNVQLSYLELTQQTDELRAFEIDIIPGHLQIPDYAMAIQRSLAGETGPITPEITDDKAATRLKSSQLLYDNSKSFWFLMAEAALRFRYAPATAMRAQLAHIGAVAGLPNVEIGIIPFDTELGTVLYNGFAIYDGLVKVENRSTEATYQPDTERANTYIEVWPRLWAQALTGDDARRLVQTTADSIDTDERNDR